jgi:hypothetical protein
MSPTRWLRDGFDCWAFGNGVDVWSYGSFAGNGFKVGGNSQQANHRPSGCVAFGNRVKGFDQHNNTGGLTIYNCTSYDNGTNFGLGNPVNSGQEDVLKNNISLGSIDTIANASQQNNSRNAGFSVSAADFVSLDPSLAVIGRNPDGTLPRTESVPAGPGQPVDRCRRRRRLALHRQRARPGSFRNEPVARFPASPVGRPPGIPGRTDAGGGYLVALSAVAGVLRPSFPPRLRAR